MKSKGIVLIAVVVIAAAAAFWWFMRFKPSGFQEVAVNIMTFTGPQIAEPLQRRAPEFEKLTGAKINIITVPFSDLYQKLLTDWAAGTNSIDAAVFAPQWMSDYASASYLEDITDRVAQDKALAEDDVGPFFRNFSSRCRISTPSCGAICAPS